MSVVLIPNQNVIFYEDQDFNARNKECAWDTRTYCQPVQYETVTQFQVKTDGITGFNLVSNGNFNVDLTSWVVGANGGWTWNTQTALLDSNSNTDKTLTQSVAGLTTNQYYKITATITDFAGDFRNSIAAMYALDAADNIIDFVVITANGDYELYAQATGAIMKVQFATNDLITLRVDDVAMSAISTVELINVTIEDCDGVYQKDVTDVVTIGNTTTITVDWVDLQAGCYRICLDGLGDTLFNYLLGGSGLISESGGQLFTEDGQLLKWV